MKLFEPIQIGKLHLKNRVAIPPMCTDLGENENGLVTMNHCIHYGTLAKGKYGMIIVEATPVLLNGKIFKNDLGIYDDSFVDGLKQLVQIIKKEGVVAAIQLGHAGRKAVNQESAIAPSPIAFSEQHQVPKEMTKEDILFVIDAFKQGARRAQDAGFDAIEIHAAHGYLINQFLSPLTNQRTDEYGGSLENRMRFLKEVISACREVFTKELFVRISASDYHPDGLNVDDYVEIVNHLKFIGIPFVDVSSGAVVPSTYPLCEGYQVPFSRQIKKETSILTGTVGLITRVEHVESILKQNDADLVFLGREALRNPYWLLDAAKKNHITIDGLPLTHQRVFSTR